MKTKILAAFAVLMAGMLGMAYAATAGATGNVTILETCGISLSADDLNFGSMNTGDTSDDVNTTISNDGSVAGDVYVSGTDWSDGNQNSFAVGQTHYALTVQQDYDQGMTVLTGSDQMFDNIANGETQDGFFKLRIPLGQTAATYAQEITFTSNCEQV
ncbi:MAG: hypothetical protein V1717_03770 [Candidatus Micrarchaeota archaeon]